nr:hypothetical protein [Lachnospiraceae bacterium]
YLIQLYFDFSGYSDMAIGLGKMFGFEFEENFDYPYLSKSITEYWRRWHISLGNWFRDYVMYPVMRTKTADRIREAGTKKFSKKTGKLLATVYATAVVWLLTGIWHGANWTFLLFGIYHGFFVILRMVLKEPWKKVEAKYHLEGKKWNTVWCILRTICLAAIGDVMFRADSMTEAFTYYKAMLGMGVAGGGATEALFFLKNFAGLYLLGILGFFPVVKKLKETTKVKEEVKDAIEAIYLILVLVISISYLTRGSYNPFVYFNF